MGINHSAELKRKLKKLIKNPPLFFRDYLNKKYPVINNEQQIPENHEYIIIQYLFSIAQLESKLEINTMPIDVVFTWVNNQDNHWQNKYQLHAKNNYQTIGLYADNSARFENHNELFYSVYSVLKYLTWVNKIFIVTDNQIPSWLNELNSPKIIIIDHSQIIDERFLPTFNSHVIEANLHKIPNLSESFIYFNDDVFVARTLPKEHFFANNNASLFLAEKSLKFMRKKGVATPTLFACHNCQTLLNRHYKINLDMPLIHTYVPLKKSYYEKSWQLYEKEILAFLPNKFRGNNDLNLATFLVPYLMYLDGHSVIRTDICYYFNIRSANAQVQYNKLLLKQKQGEMPHSFCANDFYSQEQMDGYQENLSKFLKTYFKISL